MFCCCQLRVLYHTHNYRQLQTTKKLYRSNLNIFASSLIFTPLPDLTSYSKQTQLQKMSLRLKSTSNSSSADVADSGSDPDTPKRPPPSASLSQRAISQTLSTTANLANLLPTGTLLAFQLLTPIFTSNGSCDGATRPMTLFLLVLLAASCFIASFTDSVKSNDGQVYYGFATGKGLWLFDYPVSGSGLPDLSGHRRRVIDWVHAVLSVFVFVAVALRDKNVVGCFYPDPGQETKEVLNILPVGIGVISGLLFVVFPTRRHGIGFPVTPGK